MKKIVTLFERDETLKGHPVKDVVKPETEWVLRGEGVATRKLDGTNVKIEGGVLYKRQKPTSGDYDNAAYVLASRDNPADRYLFEGFDALIVKTDGIYEAIGPKIQGNPEHLEHHSLVMVVPYEPGIVLRDVPRTFEGLRDYLQRTDIEGVVFHHPDGRMAKIKGRDFGFKRQ